MSHINLYAGKERSGQIRAKIVALSLDESKANSSQVAFNILDSAINKTLIEQVRFMTAFVCLGSSFWTNIICAALTLNRTRLPFIFEVQWQVSVEVVYELGGHFNANLSNSSDTTGSELFLSNDIPLHFFRCAYVTHCHSNLSSV